MPNLAKPHTQPQTGRILPFPFTRLAPGNQDLLHTQLLSLLGLLRLSRALATCGRFVDLAGIESISGQLCARALDVAFPSQDTKAAVAPHVLPAVLPVLLTEVELTIAALAAARALFSDPEPPP
jgi:hypothetical protein